MVTAPTGADKPFVFITITYTTIQIAVSIIMTLYETIF